MGAHATVHTQGFRGRLCDIGLPLLPLCGFHRLNSGCIISHWAILPALHYNINCLFSETTVHIWQTVCCGLGVTCPPIDSCVWTFCPQLRVLFGKAMEPLDRELYWMDSGKGGLEVGEPSHLSLCCLLASWLWIHCDQSSQENKECTLWFPTGMFLKASFWIYTFLRPYPWLPEDCHQQISPLLRSWA